PDLAAGLLPEAADLAELLAEAQAALALPGLAAPPGGQVLLEVPLTAEIRGRRLYGAIDRLIVGPDLVTAIDYKSNTVVPQRPEDVPEGLLRQMGAYAEALAQIYPDRRIETAILWTRTAELMPLPRDIVRSAMQGATIP
ncbi:double-strand break repair helicase AddA, partial [Cereibacter changlensis]